MKPSRARFRRAILFRQIRTPMITRPIAGTTQRTGRKPEGPISICHVGLWRNQVVLKCSLTFATIWGSVSLSAVSMSTMG